MWQGKNRMSKLISLIKELRLLIAIIITTGGVSALNIDIALEYIYVYNIHLGIITVLGIYINHFLGNKRHIEAEARLDLYQVQLNSIILEGNIAQLKAEVRQAFKDYHEIDNIDFVTTIKYLNGLNERRISLGINSYTEDMMKILLNKVKL